jgi:glycosyltransferase involved in cell wall biosynthesis
MKVRTGERDRPGPSITYISWAESCSRSDHTARELNGVSHMVYMGRFGSRPSTILFKYVGQAIRTARILRRERPSAVFVMTPPLFAALPAFWYARRGRAKVVLDAHSAAFMHPRWRRFQWLQGTLCRRAATTLVHNDRIAGFVHAAGGHATLVPDVPIRFSRVETFQRPPEFTIAVVCSFNYDEPVDAILAAAATLPDVRFFITGNPTHLRPDLRNGLPVNATLTGFISTAAYGGLLQGVDAVMTLTTRDHTMLRGAYEAIYQGTPVIVSDWPILRAAFDEGAAHVRNDAEGIAEGIRTMQRRHAAYRAGAERLRRRKLDAWHHTRRAIVERITPSSR